MDYIRFSINNPVKVAVAVMLLILFGLIAVWTIPVQLVPNVDQPIITVTTTWTGRSPEEVEREIVEEQEDKLKGVSNLRKLTATSSLGQAQLTLEFFVGANMTRSLQEVSNKLNEVPSYPDDVDQPVITVADSASENAIAWMVLTCDDPSIEVAGLYDLVDKRVKPWLERVEGLSEINIYGGRERQVHIRIDPKRMAERNVTFNRLRQVLQQSNVNVSAGNLREGRLDVRVRTIGQYENLEQVSQTIVEYQDGGPVRVGDLGEVVLTLEKRRSFVRSKGQPALAINAIRESGSNVMAVMNGLRSRLVEVNATILPDIARQYQLQEGLAVQPNLKLEQVYDETVYIRDAIQLVLDNLWQGGVLTVVVLLLFLRRFRRPRLVIPALVFVFAGMLLAWITGGGPAYVIGLICLVMGTLVIVLNSPPTLVITLAILIPVIGTFVVMTAFGRNLNVVSLAGLAFAVGMGIDNAIVVLENADRHISMGKAPKLATYEATREVGLAIVASTATNLVVFLPVLTLDEEVGQLFYDMSLAIIASVGLSLILAVTFVPSAAARWLHASEIYQDAAHRRFEHLFGLTDILAAINRAFANFVHWCNNPNARGTAVRLGLVTLFTLISVIGAWLLTPPTTYLPKGNRNLVFGIMLTPPGYNIEHNASIADRIEAHVRPYWEAQSLDETKKLPPAFNFMTGQAKPVPPIENYFFVSWAGTIFMGGSSRDKSYVEPLGWALSSSMMEIPGSFGFAQQISLFGRGLGGANAIDVEVSGDDMTILRAGAGALYQRLVSIYGPMSVQPSPMNFDLTGPELLVKADLIRAKDLNIDTSALGLGMEALIDGAIVGEYRYGGDSIDLLVIRSPDYPLTTGTIGEVPLAYPVEQGDDWRVAPLSTIAEITRSEAPQEIKRIEQRRAISMTITPPPTVPLQAAMETVEEIRGEMIAQNQLAPGLEVRTAGTADKLVQVREAFLGKWYGWNLRSVMSLLQSRMFLALLVNYLVMCALFESFIYPLAIMFSVPLATIGGFLGLRLLHTFDPTQLLDLVTMLGFIILLGTVVNNAILIVAQALNYMKGFGESEQDKVERMTPRQAIRESVRTRMRPVMMTAITTLFGLLPLVIKPGSGSELYRGLGAVVLGGLLISTIFTLLVVPLCFSLVLDVKIAIYRRLGWRMPELDGE